MQNDALDIDMSIRPHAFETDRPEPRTTVGFLVFLTLLAILLVGMIEPLLSLGAMMAVGIVTVVGRRVRDRFGRYQGGRSIDFEPSGKF